MGKWMAVAALMALAFAPVTQAGENLKLNPRLDYSSDSNDGPLITGDRMDDGAQPGEPNYIIIYGEGCFNSKRQARRTVSLYEKYRGRVHFVIVDLDMKQPAAKQELVGKYYKGYIPQVTILDKNGKALYDQAGEVEESRISATLDSALK